MSNEYKISTLLDIIELDEDQIDRICEELPAMLKQVKNLKEAISLLGSALGDKDTAVQILSPLTWIDDGKKDVTAILKASKI